MKSLVILTLILLSISSSLVLANHPVGISAHNGPIYTNAVLGFANITSISAYNASFKTAPYGASLQLNVVMEVLTTNKTYYIWLQDVAGFLTNNNTFGIWDNIWNFTTPFANISNVLGEGNISKYKNCTYYGTATYFVHYDFPLALYLLINESYNSSGVLVYFSYMIVQNGSEIYPPKLITYDRAFIKINDVKDAFIIINDSTTWIEYVNSTFYYYGHLLDAELVWGGYDDGEFTTFTNMSSYLALYYNDSGVFKPFSIVYSYGNDTEESADNLHVQISPNGYAYVTVGNLQPQLLTTSFNPPLPSFTFINITCKVPFYVNGTLRHSFEGYIQYPTFISFESNYTANSSAFAIYNGKNLTILPSEKFEYLNITPFYTWYYLVYINSSYPVYINGVKTNEMFVKQGETIKISVVLPSNLTGELEGTYSLPLNSTISVNQPIYEYLVTYPKAVLISQIVGLTLLLIVIFGILGFVSYIRESRKRRKHTKSFAPSYQEQQITGYIYPDGHAILRIYFRGYATIINARFMGIDSQSVIPTELHPGYNEIHVYFPKVSVITNTYYTITLLVRQGRRRFIIRTTVIGMQ